MRYMGEVLSETALRSVFESRCEDPGVFVLRDSAGTPLGDIGLRISAKNPHEADVGYALLPQAQGQGYASEALRAICDYGFTTLGIHAINAWCWEITRVVAAAGKARFCTHPGAGKCLPPQRRGLR